MKERSVGLIGFGRWGKNLARNFSQMGVLHTICDQQLPVADDVFVTTDEQELWQNSEITQIIIATPPDTHYELAKKALLAKKDVFVEKPLCLNVDEGEELVQLAEEQGLVLMVGHLLHFHPCIQKIKELVVEGNIGEIRYISSHRIGSGSLRPENVLWDLVPHDVSIILSLCENALPFNPTCQGTMSVEENILDNVMVTLQFEKDIKAHIHASWIYPFKEQKLTIIGTKGAIVFDDTNPWADKLILQKNNDTMSVDVEYKEPLFMECSHFIECCHSRKTPLTNGYEALNVLKVLESVDQSIALPVHHG